MGALALIAATGACSGTTGSGTVRTETRQVSGFTTVDLAGAGTLQIEQSGTESLTIEAEDNLLSALTSDVSNDTLTLGTKTGKNLAPRRPITYRLTVKSLTGLRLSGSGSVTATQVRAGDIAIDLSGSGDITVEGSADTTALDLSGSGTYSAAKFTTQRATAQISGSGDANLKVRDTLTVKISGSGTVSYTGDPDVTQDISGSGTVRKQP